MSVLIRVTARSTKDIIFIFNSPHESTFRINEYIIKSENVHIKLKCNHAGVDFVPSETSHIIGPSLSSKVDSPLTIYERCLSLKYIEYHLLEMSVPLSVKF